MQGKGHRTTTDMALRIMKEIAGDTIFTHENISKLIVKQSSQVDNYNDVEFVNVWLGRDNPHNDEYDAIDDTISFSTIGKNHTAFNHFIDIPKGFGDYDDFDGYSYKRGSGQIDERECAFEAAKHEAVEYGWLFELGPLHPSNVLIKLDMGLNYYFNDVYVHAPGHPWYNKCSSAIENYSYYRDKAGSKHFETLEAECRSRFPLAVNMGEEGNGVPYSVFMPVDNMGRYWYDKCRERELPACMGPVLHAVQDASIPHHAAGINGNWHTYYENVLSSNIAKWNNDINWPEEAQALLQTWCLQDSSPPDRLTMADLNRVPAINWRVDHLITWIALHAYNDYAVVYKGFKNISERSEVTFDAGQMFELTTKTLAMSALLLLKINGEVSWKGYVGNRRTKELHTPECAWLSQIKEVNRVEPLTIPFALREGYNGCHYCLSSLDK